MLQRVIIRNKKVILKKCKQNCLCVDRIKRISQKYPINSLDDMFIRFQKEEIMKEYEKCKNK